MEHQADRPSTFDPRADLPAALVVFLVALPLCLGIALASDAPLIAGVIAGVVGGVVVGMLSGSHTAVSGPAAGLAVIVASGIHDLGSYERFLAAGILAGAMQVALAVVRAGWLAALFPASVIRGMLAAIGIIVVLKQIPHALGRDGDYEGDQSFWLTSGQENTFTELMHAVWTMQPGVVIITLASLAVLLAWDHPAAQGLPLRRLFPGPLLAVGVGLAVNEVLRAVRPELAALGSDGHLVHLPELGSGSALVFPEWSALSDPEVWKVAATVAVIASLETLLGIEATDRLDTWRRRSPPDRELLAQGIGNALSSALGGLPITAVIVRSSANIQAGARSRWSSIAHGGLLFVLVAAVPDLLNRIPLASLAAILIVVGYRLARVEVFREMYDRGWVQFAPFIVTVVCTVLSDLLVGVSVGLAVGIVAVILTDHHTAITTVRDGNAWLIRFTRDATFLNKHTLRSTLDAIPAGSDVVIDGARIGFVDPDIQEVLEDFRSSAAWRDLRVTFQSLDGKVSTSLRSSH